MVFWVAMVSAQQTNVQNEIGTDNTQLFYFNHQVLGASQDVYFKPYLAYLEYNNSNEVAKDYLMDSFIFSDQYYYYKEDTSGNATTPYVGVYDEPRLETYLHDVFKRTKLPLIVDVSESPSDTKEALILDNFTSGMSYKSDVTIQTGDTWTISFDYKLDAGYDPDQQTNDILIGWNYLDSSGNTCGNSCGTDSYSGYEFYYEYKELNNSGSLSLSRTVPTPTLPGGFTINAIEIFIVNWNIKNNSKIKIDNISLIKNGPVDLIPDVGDRTFEDTDYNPDDTPWEFFKSLSTSRQYLFEERDNLLNVINDTKDSLEASTSNLSLPETKIILTLPVLDASYYYNNLTRLIELYNLIDYFFDETGDRIDDWQVANGTDVSIAGFYFYDEYITDEWSEESDTVPAHWSTVANEASQSSLPLSQIIDRLFELSAY